MLKRSARPRSQKPVVVLVAAGYDEVAVAHYVGQLRDKGVMVSLVSISAGLVLGAHGMTLLPDNLIDQAIAAAPPKLIIVPGSAACAEALSADPRVHQLIKATVRESGYVAAPHQAQTVLARRGLWSTRATNYLAQGNTEPADFMRRLVGLMIEPEASRAGGP